MLETFRAGTIGFCNYLDVVLFMFEGLFAKILTSQGEDILSMFFR